MNRIKGLFKKREEHVPGLTIEKDGDGYSVVYHTKTTDPLVICSSYSQAFLAAQELGDCHDWRKRTPLKTLKEQDRNTYKQIKGIIARHNEKKVFNGAYRDTEDEQGMVTYRLHQHGKVKGEFVSEGLAIRANKGVFVLDHIPSGLVLTTMDEKQHLQTLVEHTRHVVRWEEKDAPHVINEQEHIKTYFISLKQAIQKGDELPVMGDDQKMTMDFHYEEKSQSRADAFEEAMNRLNGMIGLDNIKSEIHTFMESLQGEKRLREAGGIKLSPPTLHMLFMGPPGSGKTEVARIISSILYALGFIRKRTCIEVSRKDLVSEYIGGTEKMTAKVIESALGGVLFVDEAYTLNGGDQQDHGRKALEEIMRAMENKRDDLVVVFAGYQSDLEELFKVNEGIRSRFPYTFTFQDYTPDQVASIAQTMLESKGYDCRLAEGELARFMKAKSRSGVIEGNARAARTAVERIIQFHKVRIGKAPKGVNVREITPEDIKQSGEDINRHRDADGLRSVREAGMAKLNAMVGLDELKDQILTWINYVTIEAKRFERGLSSEMPSMHMTFEGEPGTGKTTVASIVAEILKGSGRLSSGHFIEASRSDLVGKFQGHTADQVRKVVAKALGGVLFIDEAYDLVNGEEDSFGKEAVNTLILEMENNRDNLVVILGGYTDRMEQLLQTNPGFDSRIAERFVFPDYQEDELVRLADMRLNQLRFTVEEGAREVLHQFIRETVGAQGGRVDGNGRWVRQLCEKIKMAQANRLVSEGSDELDVITAEDVHAGKKRMRS